MSKKCISIEIIAKISFQLKRTLMKIIDDDLFHNRMIIRCSLALRLEFFLLTDGFQKFSERQLPTTLGKVRLSVYDCYLIYWGSLRPAIDIIQRFWEAEWNSSFGIAEFKRLQLQLSEKSFSDEPPLTNKITGYRAISRRICSERWGDLHKTVCSDSLSNSAKCASF